MTNPTNTMPAVRDFSIRLERTIEGGPGTYGHVEFRYGIWHEAAESHHEVDTNTARCMLAKLLDYDRTHSVLDAVTFDGAAFRVTNLSNNPDHGIAVSI